MAGEIICLDAGLDKNRQIAGQRVTTLECLNCRGNGTVEWDTLQKLDRPALNGLGREVKWPFLALFNEKVNGFIV